MDPARDITSIIKSYNIRESDSPSILIRHSAILERIAKLERESYETTISQNYQ